MKKIIVIAPDVSDKGLAASFRINLILQAFFKKKFSVLLVTSTYPVSKHLESFQNLEVKRVVNHRNNSFLIRVFSKLFGIPDPLALWSLKVFFLLLFSQRKFREFDFAFLSSPPHSIHIFGILGKLFFKLPYYADFRDDWMGSHRMTYPSIFHKKISGYLEKLVLKNASGVFSAIPIVAKGFILKYPMIKEKVFIATNGYSNSFATKLKSKNFGESYSKNTLVYCGGDYNGFISKRFNQLANDLRGFSLDEKWKIITAGPGIMVEDSNKEVWEHMGLVSPDRVNEIIANATTHLSVLPDGDLTNSRTIPLKMYSQIVTKGSIIFIGNSGATNDVFEGIPGVFFLTPDKWNRLSSFLSDNISLLEERYERKVEQFNFDNIANKLIDAIIKIEYHETF